MPSVAQVRELPVLVRHTVPPHWEDLNGHVNVQHYTELYDMAGYPFMELMGISPAMLVSSSAVRSGCCR
jgi:acyl-CoA thioester hydrolase